MTMNDYLAEIKLELTGNVLELDLDDATLIQIVNKALREVNRYLDQTKLITVPYAPCIDLTDSPISSVARVFRTEGIGSGEYKVGEQLDPFYAQIWMNFGNTNNIYNLNNFVNNYASWNTMLQIRNTISTDLAFRYEEHTKKLYINALAIPAFITIEYVPLITNVEEITSVYWIDILTKLSIALAKLYEGRIRTRYSQSNSLWAQDGERLLDEANTELTTLREQLRINSQLTYIYD